MAYSKIILNGDTLMDVTDDTVDAGKLLYGETATKNSGAKVTGNIASKSSSDLTASGATVTAPAGYYSSNASKSVDSMTLPTSASSTSTGTRKATISSSTSTQYINIPTGYNSANAYYKLSAMPTGTAGTPTATKGTVSNHSITVTPSVTNTTGYITGSTKTGTAVTVSASELVSGTKSIDDNGTGIDVTNYASVDVNVSGGASNVVYGTFTTSSTSGTQQTISIPYTGSGYPIMTMVEVVGGVDIWSSNSLSSKIVGQITLSKVDQNVAMRYDSYDQAVGAAWVTTAYGSTSIQTSKQVYIGGQYTQQTSPTGVLVFGSATTLYAYICNNGSQYGLNPSTDYTYVIVYSS